MALAGHGAEHALSPGTGRAGAREPTRQHDQAAQADLDSLSVDLADLVDRDLEDLEDLVFPLVDLEQVVAAVAAAAVSGYLRRRGPPEALLSSGSGFGNYRCGRQ